MTDSPFEFKATVLTPSTCCLRVARNLEGEVHLPAEIDGRRVVVVDPIYHSFKGNASLIVPEGVVAIGHETFIDAFKLDAITLPDSLRSIGINPFLNNGIREIRINPEHPVFSFRDGFLINKQTGTLISALENHCGEVIRLPEGLSIIGNRALDSFDDPHDVIIPEGVHTINELAFNQFFQLGQVTFPSTLRVIRRYAFQCCWVCDPKDLILPEGLEILRGNVFLGCEKLRSVTLPASLREIGEYAFCGCAEDFTLRVHRGTFGEQYALSEGYRTVYAD